MGTAILEFLKTTGFYQIFDNPLQLVMLLIACVLLYLAIVKKFEPLLLLPIAFGMLLTNLPGAGLYHADIYAEGHVNWTMLADPKHCGLLDYLYLGVKLGIYPCLIFMGVGAMTDFGPLIANPISLLMGVLVTIAEPDLQVLAEQVPSIPNMTIVLTVAVGVGIFLAMAVLRILFKIDLSWLLMIMYTALIVMSFFVPDSFIAVAFDSGGVTTGPITVPFIMAMGVGLSMDAFSISVANGIVEPGMKKFRMFKIAGVYAVFQFIMPVLGWLLVTTVAEMFSVFHKFIPWIALILLLFIGGKMVFEGIRDKKQGYKKEKEEVKEAKKLTWGALIVQGIATSIDALSVGFTIADYSFLRAFAASLIIGAVTLVICLLGLIFGKKIGGKFVSTATIIGGVILILIGIEIFIKGIFGL